MNLSDNTKAYLCEFQSILNKMTDGMTTAELNNSISHNFIVQMIPHHRGAIEMSENILRYTTDISVQNIASRIIKEQTKSINDMLAVKDKCSCLENSPADVCRYQNKVSDIMTVMFNGMGGACGNNNLNADFMREMIPHHRGAVEMGENALCYRICPELKPIIESIITSQKRGIAEMQRLLCCCRQ